MVKNLPPLWETQVWSLGWEDTLKKEMATHSSILAWREPLDRGAWLAPVLGVEKSQAWLNDWAHTHGPTNSPPWDLEEQRVKKCHFPIIFYHTEQHVTGKQSHRKLAVDFSTSFKLTSGRRYGACCHLAILDYLKSANWRPSLCLFLLLSWAGTHDPSIVRNPRRQWVTTVPKESLGAAPDGSCPVIFWNLVDRTSQENSEGGHSLLIRCVHILVLWALEC